MEHQLTIAYINAVGQSGLTRTKQTQIESFLLREKIDILNIQEIDIDSNSFSHCPEISSSYNILSNNALSKYGTAVLLKSDLSPTNIQNDSSQRKILIKIEKLLLVMFTYHQVQTPLQEMQERNIFRMSCPKCC